jgi:two-component system OmpR family sensor kinase/two-component system sensor histidine kinase BaeS
LPDDEPWPPQRPPWSKIRRFFFWRVLGLLVILTLIAAGVGALTSWFTFISSGKPNIQHDGLPPFFFCGVFLIGLLGFMLVGRLLRRVTTPVGELMEAVGRVEAGDYSARVGEHGPREVRALVRAFNAMAERLQLNETQRRNLLADVTHELRTPLTVIQGNLEGLLDGVYPRDDAHLGLILEDTRVLARLIDDLRTLSLAESGALHLHREPTDFSVLAGETAASFRTQAEAAGVELSVSTAEDMPLLEIDPMRIREVLSNLIANALRYTSAGRKVRVTAQLNPDERHVAVSVSDTGTGIAAADLPHIFDRFYKAGNSRGTGLGLAIAKNLITAHGGQISAQSDGLPDHGTTIRFTLPLSPGL